MATDKYLNLQGLIEVADKVNEKLKTVTVMPAEAAEGDFVLYKGETTEEYIKGLIYSYDYIETYYAWRDNFDTCYTKTFPPSVGDAIYNDTEGTESGYFVEQYDSVNNTITSHGVEAARAEALDAEIYKWVPHHISIILNGENVYDSEVSAYAPIDSGERGQTLFSNGENQAPSWAALSGYSPTVVEDSLIFSYGVLPEVENTSLVFNV